MSTPHESAELVGAIADAIEGADRSAGTLDWTPEARAALAAITEAGYVVLDKVRAERLIALASDAISVFDGDGFDYHGLQPGDLEPV